MVKKSTLRAAAYAVLQTRGYGAIQVRGPGIVPGARLKATKGTGAGQQIAVRTSQDREVGLLRRFDNQSWRTIPNVYEVVAAVPSLTQPHSSIDVFCFDPKKLIARFDAAVQTAGHGEVSPKAPVFIALDENPQKSALTTGLAADAKWRDEISVEAIVGELSPSDGFVERVKQEFAELNGVDVSKVIVEFRIIA